MGDYRSEYRGKELRSAVSIVNKIIAIRKYPGNELRSFLIIEGSSDEKLYGQYIHPEWCEITVAYNKANAIEVISTLESNNFSGALAIVDADFDVVGNSTTLSHNLLYTDTHDLETMMIKSPALEKVLSEFGAKDKISVINKTGKDARTLLIKCASPLGYLRWVSLKHDLALTFEKLSFDKFVDKDDLTIDTAKMIKTVKEKSQKLGLIDADIQQKMAQVQKDTHDSWHICCGHDLVCILALGLRKALGSHSTGEVEPDIVEKWLRLAYERSFFIETRLYTAIRQWEQDNHPFVILFPVQAN